MKEIIERVLERFGGQTNLGSKAARERISSEIEAVLQVVQVKKKMIGFVNIVEKTLLQ